MGVAALALVALPAAEVAFAVVRRLRGRTVPAGRRPGPSLRPAGATGAGPAWRPALAYIGGRGGGGRRAPWSSPSTSALGAAVAVDVGGRRSSWWRVAAATGALAPDREAAA